MEVCLIHLFRFPIPSNNDCRKNRVMAEEIFPSELRDHDSGKYSIILQLLGKLLHNAPQRLVELRGIERQECADEVISPSASGNPCRMGLCDEIVDQLIKFLLADIDDFEVHPKIQAVQ